MKKNEKGKLRKFTPQEKVILALKKVSPGYRPDCSTWVREIAIEHLVQQPKQDGEAIHSSGTCVMHLRRTGDGMILSPDKVRYRVECEDSKDEMGLADIKVNNWDFTEI